MANLRMIRGAQRALPPWSVELYARRVAAGLTQLEAALHYGVNERTYRRWELGFGDGRMLGGLLALMQRRKAA